MDPHKAKKYLTRDAAATVAQQLAHLVGVWRAVEHGFERPAARVGEAVPVACDHASDPRGCYRVRCQLGRKCVDDEMSPRSTQPTQPPAEAVNARLLDLAQQYTQEDDATESNVGKLLKRGRELADAVLDRAAIAAAESSIAAAGSTK